MKKTMFLAEDRTGSFQAFEYDSVQDATLDLLNAALAALENLGYHLVDESDVDEEPS
jgi:hypothetical protein